MRGIRISSDDLAKYIRNADDICHLILPGVDDTVADALVDRAKQKRTSKAIVVVDGSHHAERSGYGETSAWRRLNDEKNIELKTVPGTRLGCLVTEHGAWLFAPRAGKLDPREEEGLSAVQIDEANREDARIFCERIVGFTYHSPQGEKSPEEQCPEHEATEHGREEGEPRAKPITDQQIAEAERAIEEHPPRDYSKERMITVYTQYVGYIEIRLVGASHGKGTLMKIPPELVALGLDDEELRGRISESVRIDLNKKVDTGVATINERLNAIRTLYTRQLGQPHGRIYRKRQKEELENHLEDLRKEIAQANDTLVNKIDKALKEELDDLATKYFQQSERILNEPGLDKDRISDLLLKAWRQSGVARQSSVKLEVTFKELTWESLKDNVLSCQIVELFPDLKESSLYKEFEAHSQV